MLRNVGVVIVWRMAYGAFMLDVMQALKDRRLKAEGKVARTIKALETAQKELADVIAAERVMADITGESVEQKPSGGALTDRDIEITKLLGVGEPEAKSPIELYPLYAEAHGPGLNLEAFRTALWRLQKKTIPGTEKTWAVRSEGGKYWREAADSTADDIDILLVGESDER